MKTKLWSEEGRVGRSVTYWTAGTGRGRQTQFSKKGIEENEEFVQYWQMRICQLKTRDVVVVVVTCCCCWWWGWPWCWEARGLRSSSRSWSAPPMSCPTAAWWPPSRLSPCRQPEIISLNLSSLIHFLFLSDVCSQNKIWHIHAFIRSKQVLAALPDPGPGHQPSVSNLHVVWCGHSVTVWP